MFHRSNSRLRISFIHSSIRALPNQGDSSHLLFPPLHDNILNSMNRTFVIARHTFFEAALQPIYSLLLVIGSVIIIVFGLLPFFTLSEDTAMFKLVCLDIIRLLVLITTLFATSKSIYEEIEDRTMLTLMSKPLHRVEVLVGKYLGIITAAAAMMAMFGLVLAIATWWRIPTDYLIPARTLDDREAIELLGIRKMHLAGLGPALLLDWMQIAVLAAIGVTISVRVSLVVNLPVVIILYILCNLTRFLYPLDRESAATKAFAFLASTVLPALELFDIRDNVVHKKLAIAQFVSEPGALALSSVWWYVAAVCCYAVVYVLFVLTLGVWAFRNRELGGAEG